MSKTCPRYIVALLKDLSSELERVQWNVNQEEYDSPFYNTGNEFKTDVFEVRAYYWGDDETEMDKPNFKCGDLEISWYKHLGRGTTINKRVSRRKMENIYLKCLISIQKWEQEQENDPYRTPINEKEDFKRLKGYHSYRLNPIKRLKLWWHFRHDSEESF